MTQDCWHVKHGGKCRHLCCVQCRRITGPLGCPGSLHVRLHFPTPLHLIAVNR